MTHFDSRNPRVPGLEPSKSESAAFDQLTSAAPTKFRTPGEQLVHQYHALLRDLMGIGWARAANDRSDGAKVEHAEGEIRGAILDRLASAAVSNDPKIAALADLATVYLERPVVVPRRNEIAAVAFQVNVLIGEGMSLHCFSDVKYGPRWMAYNCEAPMTGVWRPGGIEFQPLWTVQSFQEECQRLNCPESRAKWRDQNEVQGSLLYYSLLRDAERFFSSRHGRSELEAGPAAEIEAVEPSGPDRSLPKGASFDVLCRCAETQLKGKLMLFVRRGIDISWSL